MGGGMGRLWKIGRWVTSTGRWFIMVKFLPESISPSRRLHEPEKGGF